MKKAMLLMLCPLVALSCWLPPYDAGLSDSERFIAQIGAPVASFSLRMKSYEGENGYYLPPRDPASYDAGFWVSSSDGTLQVRSVYYDAVTLSRYFNGSWSDMERFAPYSLVNADASDPQKVIIVSNPKQGVVVLTRDASGSLTSGSTALSPQPSGVGFFRVDQSTDALFFPDWASLPILSVLRYEAGSSGLMYSSQTDYQYDSSLSAPAAPAFFAVDAAGDSYLSATLADGSTQVFRWLSGNESSVPEPLSFIGNRIDGMLADGRLYAQSDGRLTLYDPAASSAKTLRSGSCRFIHERYDTAAAEWIAVFTRSYAASISSNDDSADYRIELFEVPSSELSGLAD